ncbi:hypothetical protein AYO44_05045 [Planctomycetaceae bacterium SCGC AG-212-F19]|nr:hypothetical protein AYO44_05045 [Planctomycetaceae bacterium SCGC AG-212-F19]
MTEDYEEHLLRNVHFRLGEAVLNFLIFSALAVETRRSTAPSGNSTIANSLESGQLPDSDSNLRPTG